MGLSLLACGLVDNFPLCSKLPTGPTGSTTMMGAFLFRLSRYRWSTFRWPSGQLFDGHIFSIFAHVVNFSSAKRSTFHLPKTAVVIRLVFEVIRPNFYICRPI
jgi:hypothetical protein